ncbi:hypothetical protein E2562_006225 [Oryza meyeriana var. granulata]|uniref:Uncharacterized protein n=1 Tax=Oryza meyeriana var. granulata TaxID=110450 RepID=A0A6G1CNQ1_9ORYZ|nr:hypothetical protein E2562_006225 [Oryza meyeriana var. granulata]
MAVVRLGLRFDLVAEAELDAGGQGDSGGSVHISNGDSTLTCSQADATCISDELYSSGKCDRAKSPSLGGNPMTQDPV